MNWLDICILTVIIVSIIYSAFRGIIREIFSLLAFIIGLLIAARLYPKFASWFVDLTGNSAAGNIISFLLIFTLSAVIITLIGGFFT